MSRMVDTFQADYDNAVKAGNAPAGYGSVVHAYGETDRYGAAVLIVKFTDGRKLSPYFNQNGSEGDCWGLCGEGCLLSRSERRAHNGDNKPVCLGGYCGSDNYSIEYDGGGEWADMMSGATEWSEGEWTEIT